MLPSNKRIGGHSLVRNGRKATRRTWVVPLTGTILLIACLSLLVVQLCYSAPSNTISPNTTQQDPIAAFHEAFAARYGANAYESMYEKSIMAYADSQLATANRFLTAAATNTPFVLSFAGYSVTVGRGNRLDQSYPFVLERLLQPLVAATLTNTQVKVRNSAIGGIPSFPYGFCFEHFLGNDADVVSWDYSMNEGKGAAVLEAYVRQSQTQLDKHPMMIVLDTNKQRCKLLREYAESGLIADAICVGMAKTVLDSKIFDQPDDALPPGLQKWNEFGAPANCPGRGSWHPKRQEHEWVGWMLAMYFVQALELARTLQKKDPHWLTTYGTATRVLVPFPKPLATAPDNNSAVTQLLYGYENPEIVNQYVPTQISCRTNFLPATDHDKVLPSIVVSGLAPRVTVENIMEERSDNVYATGWVLDVSKLERETKVKVEACGGLGYIDMKIALYGIPESGPLVLWLPSESTEHKHANHDVTTVSADHWFDAIVICEANEKRPASACQLDRDLEYMVGGVTVDADDVVPIQGAAEYLKRRTCVHVGVPNAAQITKRGGLPSSRNNILHEYKDDHVGLAIKVKVKSDVTREKGACCISHVVWGQH